MTTNLHIFSQFTNNTNTSDAKIEKFSHLTTLFLIISSYTFAAGLRSEESIVSEKPQ